MHALAAPMKWARRFVKGRARCSLLAARARCGSACLLPMFASTHVTFGGHSFTVGHGDDWADGARCWPSGEVEASGKVTGSGQERCVWSRPTAATCSRVVRPGLPIAQCTVTDERRRARR
jgi:hypothetical protein